MIFFLPFLSVLLLNWRAGLSLPAAFRAGTLGQKVARVDDVFDESSSSFVHHYSLVHPLGTGYPFGTPNLPTIIFHSFTL